VRVFVAFFFAMGFLLVQFSSPDLVLATYETGDQTRVIAGLAPGVLAWSVLAMPFVVFLIKRSVPSEGEAIPSWRRRFAAFVIDFVVIFAAIVPPVMLIPLGVEAARTGSFAWAFDRDFTVASDWLVHLLLVVGIMGAMLLYFAVPVVRGTQTVGCYLLRLKVVPVEGRQPRLYDAMKRAVLGYLGICMGPLTFWRGRGADGSTWYDRSTQCRVRLVRYVD
jgi:uncharacterized RDD family membrane protein YckC